MWVGLSAPADGEIDVLKYPIRVMVPPLTVHTLDIETLVDGPLVGGEGHVGIDVPVLKSVNDVD